MLLLNQCLKVLAENVIGVRVFLKSECATLDTISSNFAAGVSGEGRSCLHLENQPRLPG